MRKVISLFLLGFCVAQGVAAQGKDGRTFGDWTLSERVDPMTDKRSCLLVYAKQQEVIYSDKDAFRFGSLRLGGVTSYRYRFGKWQASEVHMVPPDERVAFSVPVFVREALDAPLLRVVGTSVVKQAFDLEISLRGLKQGREAMAQRCGVERLPSAADAPAWAQWQVSPPAGD